eukprot:4915879-Heterocapsa_arctica.AAC.1
MIKTVCGNRQKFDEIAKALRQQHPRVHMKENRTKPADDTIQNNQYRPWSSGKGKGKYVRRPHAYNPED